MTARQLVAFAACEAVVFAVVFLVTVHLCGGVR